MQLHARAGFNLRAFRSNSRHVQRHFDCNKVNETRTMDLDRKKLCEKALGLHWDTDTDEFFFEFKFQRVPAAVINGDRPPTKREWLSLVMSVFDPFGFLANITILAKIILQCTWSVKLGWDDSLPPHLVNRLQPWLVCMRKLSFHHFACHAATSHA